MEKIERITETQAQTYYRHKKIILGLSDEQLDFAVKLENPNFSGSNSQKIEFLLDFVFNKILETSDADCEKL